MFHPRREALPDDKNSRRCSRVARATPSLVHRGKLVLTESHAERPVDQFFAAVNEAHCTCVSHERTHRAEKRGRRSQCTHTAHLVRERSRTPSHWPTGESHHGPKEDDRPPPRSARRVLCHTVSPVHTIILFFLLLSFSPWPLPLFLYHQGTFISISSLCFFLTTLCGFSRKSHATQICSREVNE